MLKTTKLESQLVRGFPVGYLQSMVELSSGLPKTNPASGREEDWNPGLPDYKSSALTTSQSVLMLTYMTSLFLFTGKGSDTKEEPS